MQFSTKIDSFEQKDSQGFENSYNSYEQYPLEKFFIFTIYQNYTLALRYSALSESTLLNFLSYTYTPAITHTYVHHKIYCICTDTLYTKAFIECFHTTADSKLQWRM